MENLIQADIFFFVTTVAIVVIGIGLAVVIAYAVAILRDVRDIARLAKEESELMIKDLAELRINVKRGMVVGGAIRFVKNILKGNRKNRKSKED